MAGIGFELKRSLRRRSYSAYIRAYAAALAYSSGPWICTILALALIFLFSRDTLGRDLIQQFNIVVVYIYAFSLLLTGPIQMLTTRFVADNLYANRKDLILPGVWTAFVFTAALSGVVGFLFSLLSELPLAFEVSAIALFMLISCLWTTMSYISCLKQYKLVVWSFAVGAAVSVGAAVALSRTWELDILGLIWGYALGHLLILLSLILLSRDEFPGGSRWLPHFFSYARRYPALLVAGLLINLIIWIDKFTIWAYRGEHVWAGFVFYAPYDIPAYLAYVSVIPSLALFLIKIETAFAELYERFTRSLLDAPLEIIKRRKEAMIKSMRSGLVQLLKFQGVVSTVAIIYASDILKFLHLGKLSPTLFRILLLGAYFHFAAIHALVFLMYLDRKRTLVRIFGFFALASFLGTVYCAGHFETPYLGLGYLIAAFVTAAIAIPSLLRAANNIDCDVLFRQPLLGPEGNPIKFRSCSPDCYRGKTIHSR